MNLNETFKIIGVIVFMGLLVTGAYKWERYTWKQSTVTYKAQMRHIAPEPERGPSTADTRIAEWIKENGRKQ